MWYHLRYRTWYQIWTAGLRVPHRPLPQQPQCGCTGGRRSERCRSGSAWKQGRSACARRGGGQPRRASAAGSRQRKRAWRAARAPRRRKAQHHCASLHLCWGSSELNRRLFWQTSSKFCGIPMTVSCVDLMLWLTVKSRCYRNPWFGRTQANPTFGEVHLWRN